MAVVSSRCAAADSNAIRGASDDSRESEYHCAPMTVQTFREMLARRPFQPVKIAMSSGQTFEIRHPETAFLTRTSLLIGVDVADDGIPQEFKILSLLHVTSMEPLGNQAA